MNLNLDNGIRFKCQGSGNCCVSRDTYGYVYLSDNDSKKLSKYLNLNLTKFKKKYCSNTEGFTHLKEIKKNKGNCIFLKDKRCSVYKSRPIQCRTWPFWNENMHAKRWNLKITKFCPGINKGAILSKKKILNILEKDKKNDELILKQNINHQK
tara:strand:- start:446 stop:904 length:459 start_codon:yes stop_codon:yes gene_type:complete